MNENYIRTINSPNIANYSIYSQGANKTQVSSVKNTDNMTNYSSLDKVEISEEAKGLYVAASSSKSSSSSLMDKAKSVVDTVTDFIPGVGTAKDIYNLYKTITSPTSTATEIGWAIADLVPGPSLSKLKKFAQTIINKFDLDSSSTRKLNESLVKASSKKIKDMSITDTQTFIRKSESTSAGHAKRDHLDITDEALKTRSKTEGVTATKFTNGATMKEFVNYAMDKNADEIASWLNSTSNKSLSFTVSSNKSLGHGFEYSSSTKKYKEYKNIQQGTVVLIKDTSPNSEYGFTLLTAYPKAK